MKRLLLSLALVLFATVANAQLIGRYGSTQVIAGGTNNIINLASNTYTFVIDCRDVNELGIQINAGLIVSNFCKPRLDMMETVDGTTFTSTNLVVMSCLGGLSTNDLSAGQVCYVTNISVRGIQGLKGFRLANTDYHGIMTNLTLTFSTKR